MSGAGEQMFLGIRLSLDASGVVTGASLAKNSVRGIGDEAVRTQRKIKESLVPPSPLKKLTSDSNTEMAAGFGMVGIAAYGAGRAIETGFINPARELAMGLESELSSLKFVANASEATMEKFTNAAEQVGIETLLTAKEAVQGLNMFSSSGWGTDEAIKGMESAVSLVTGFQKRVSLEDTSKALAILTRAFSATGESAETMAAKMVSAANSGQIQPEDFRAIADSMRSAPVLMKDTAESALAIISTLKGGGMQAADAAHAYSVISGPLLTATEQMEAFAEKTGQTLNDVFTKPQKGMKAKAAALKEFGIQVFDPYTNKIKPTLQLLGEFGDKAMEMTGRNQKKFMLKAKRLLNNDGLNVLTSMMKATQDNAKETGITTVSGSLANYAAQIAKTDGVLKAAADSYAKTTAGRVENIKGSIESVLTSVGKKVMAIESSFVDMGLLAIGSFASILKGDKNASAVIAGTSMALSILLKVIGLVGIALGGMLLWAELVGPAIGKMGGWSVVASRGMAMLGTAMKGVMASAGVLLGVMAAVYGTMWLWDKIWDTNSGGAFQVIRTVFKDIRDVISGFIDWMDGSSDDLDLYKRLEARNLTGVVITLLQVKDRIVAIFKGIWKAIKVVFVPFKLIGKLFMWLYDTIMWGAEVFELLSKGTKDSSKNISDSIPAWETVGKAIGYIVMTLLSLYIIRTAVAIVRTIAMAAAQWGLNAAMLVGVGKFILIAAAVAVAIMAYSLLLKKCWEFGEWLGNELYQGVEDAKVGFATFGQSMSQVGSEFSKTFQQGLMGDWQPFYDFISGLVNYVKTAFSVAFGSGSIQDLVKAVPKSMVVDKELQQAIKNDVQGGGSTVNRDDYFASQSRAKEKLNTLYQDQMSKGNTTNIQKIEIVTQGMNSTDALAAARQFMEKVASAKDAQEETGFGSGDYFAVF